MAEPDAEAPPGVPEARAAEDPPSAPTPNPKNNAPFAALLAWLIPGAGHFYLGRRGRAVLFLILILTAVVVGVALQGKLWRIAPGQPLSVLGTLGCAGLGLPYLVLRFVLGYEGNIIAQGYEYGAAFLVTGGLMNLLLVLDAWDIARGIKE